MDAARRTRLLERLEALRDEATQALAAASGGQSLCRVGRDHGGGGPPDLKTQEGRMAVFAELRRALTATTDDESLATVLAESRVRWETLRRKHADSPQGAWFAYASGGLAALDEVVAAIEG